MPIRVSGFQEKHKLVKETYYFTAIERCKHNWQKLAQLINALGYEASSRIRSNIRDAFFFLNYSS